MIKLSQSETGRRNTSMQIKLPISDAAFFFLSVTPFIRNNFSWATKLRQKISISANAETYCIYIHFLFTIYCNLFQSFVTSRPFRLSNNLVNRAVEFFLNRSPEATPRIVFYCKQKKRRNLEFTKDLIIDTISYKAHFLLLKL